MVRSVLKNNSQIQIQPRNIVILRGGHLGKKLQPQQVFAKCLASVSWQPNLPLAMALVADASLPRVWRSVSWGLRKQLRYKVNVNEKTFL